MAIDVLETVGLIELLENFIEKIRPAREEARKELDFGYNIEDQSVLLLEIRPDWRNREIIRQSPFAKATYVKKRAIWKIFWMRANLKWYPYDPKPTVKSLRQFLEIVKADQYHCFFG
ncbi:MAG TPA: DUF3024 domain-containing protein [Chitinophagaceae bacterium]|jgi:hypothetical protein